MPKNTSKPLNITGCLFLHSPAQPRALPGSQRRVLIPASLLLACLCLGAQQAQAATFKVKEEETVKNVVIDNGDQQDVLGKAINTTVLGKSATRRSTQNVYGTAETTSVEKDGTQNVQEGGSAKDTTVEQDGKVFVESGGTIENLTVKSGGSAYLNPGSIWKGSIIYDRESVILNPNTLILPTLF